MKFKEYVDMINKIYNGHPKVKDYEVVYSVDPEGNGFFPVDFIPVVGYYNDKTTEFFPKCDFEYFKIVASKENSICIN